MVQYSFKTETPVSRRVLFTRNHQVSDFICTCGWDIFSNAGLCISCNIAGNIWYWGSQRSLFAFLSFAKWKSPLGDIFNIIPAFFNVSSVKSLFSRMQPLLKSYFLTHFCKKDTNFAPRPFGNFWLRDWQSLTNLKQHAQSRTTTVAAICRCNILSFVTPALYPFHLNLVFFFNLFIYICSLQHECVYKEKKIPQTVQSWQKKNNFYKTLQYLFWQNKMGIFMY